MANYIFRRILSMIRTLLIVAVIVFLITRMIPGNPAAVMLGPQAGVDEVEKLTEQLGLNDPLYKQFIDYIGGLLQGDFGNSLSYHQPIVNLILERFPNTLILAVSALMIAFMVGVPAGILADSKQNSIVDYSITGLWLIGVSMPCCWVGWMLVLVFIDDLGWVDAMGMGSINEGLRMFKMYLILPSITLASIPTTTFARITRSSM